VKSCPKCSSQRPLSAFGKDRSRKDGLQVWCKPCQQTYRKANRERVAATTQAWRKANPEKMKENRSRRRARPEVREKRAAYNRDWKKRNPEKVKTQNKRSYNCHVEERRQVSRDYALKHPEEVKERQQRWRQENKGKIREYRRKNRDRDLVYYAKNKEKFRLMHELKRRWVVYKIQFADGTYYVGSSSHYNFRFNNHKSKAKKKRHIKALNHKDFTTAEVSVLHDCENEIEALEKEASVVRQKLEDDLCLNIMVPTLPQKLFWVYVIQSEQKRFGKEGKELPGFFYVGMTVNPARRLRQHNGLKANGEPGLKGGGKYTAKRRPWVPKALFGPYFTRSEALRAEYALKRQKRGEGRLKWSSEDSEFCRGEGAHHPWAHDPMWEPQTPEEWRAGSVVEPT